MFNYLVPDKTCVLVNNKLIIYQSVENGVKPLVKYLYYKGIPNKETVLIDKIVGYAVANLILYSQIKTVYTKIISKPALTLLNNNNITLFYESIVENILRRDKSDICPLEKKLLTVKSPEQAMEFLTQIVIFNNPIHLKQ